MLLDLLRDFSLANLLALLLLIPALLVSLSFHEFAHAFAANSQGDGYAKATGRMTLNPMKHLDPIGFLFLLIAGFGWAKPVPIVESSFKNGKRSLIIVSLAGILMNIMLAFLALNILYFLRHVVGAVEFLIFNSIGRAIRSFFDYFVSINLTLAVFNLIPVPPLDGYRVVNGLFCNYRNQYSFRKYEQYGQIILLLILVTGISSGFISTVRNWLLGLMSSLCDLIYGAFI